MENEGDCDTDSECLYGHLCGEDNCPVSFGYDSAIDCCYIPSNGDEKFCKVKSCGNNQGDCDSNEECQENHFCGSNNCPTVLGFDFEVDCCSSTQLMSPDYPNNYPKNIDETWLITAPYGEFVYLQFHDFQVSNFIIIICYHFSSNKCVVY